MRRRPFALLLLLCVLAPSFAQEPYFPQGVLEDDAQGDSFRSNWYSKHLKALEEPSLFQKANDTSAESYRFVWLRSFNHPVAVRLDIMGNGTGKLTVKMASGAGGYQPGKLIENTSRSVTREQTDKFLEQVKGVGFWELPSYEKTSGCDGAQWIIEGLKDGKYHVVDRWTPRNGPVHDLGITLAFTFAHLKIPKDQVY